MKIVAMIDRSAGNDSVGEMWTETKIFDSTATLDSVYEWVSRRISMCLDVSKITTNIKLSIAQEEAQP